MRQMRKPGPCGSASDCIRYRTKHFQESMPMKTPTPRLMIAAGTVLAVSLPFAGLAGIQGSGFRSLAVVAPVTGTSGGTVSVGGVPYSDSGATVEVDGQSGSASQIKVG